MTENADREPKIAIGGREQLFHLIAEASEVEHTLMCSYLFAAFSLRDPIDASLSRTEAEAVERWRASIIAVAMDEMVHLLLVANLSIAIGGRPHFGRPNFPVEPGYFPADVVVRLTAFSADTLDHFIFLERPQGYQLEDGDGFEPEREYAREESYEGLMPSVQDYDTVGRLYEALRVNLIACADRLGERGLFVGPVIAQVGRDGVDLDGVETIADLSSALRAIDTIVEQGEGSPAHRDNSHYQRFCAIRDEHAKLLARNPAFQPALPVADNPVMRRPPTPEGKTFIDDPRAAPVIDLGNAIYAMLLQLIVQAFGRTGPQTVAGQQRSLTAAIGLMHLLSRVARALAELPASSAAPGLNAGLSFTMLRSVEPFFVGEAEERLVMERLSELAMGSRTAAAVAPSLSGLDGAIAVLAAPFTPACDRPPREDE